MDLSCLRCKGSGKEPPVTDGASCKSTRRALGITTPELARAVGISHGMVTHLETGLRAWSGPATERIAAYLTRRASKRPR